MVIDFAGLPCSGKILALWDDGHVSSQVVLFFSSQVLFWVSKSIEPRSKCTGAHIPCETVSFSTGVFRNWTAKSRLKALSASSWPPDSP